MKKFYLFITVPILLFFISCAPSIVHAPVGGVMPSLVVTDVVYPSKWDSEGLRHTIRGAYNYKIIKPVKVSTESTNILGIIAQGNSGYKKLLDKAKNEGADNVINVIVDTKYSYYLFGIFQRVRTDLYGLAIKYVPAKQRQPKVRSSLYAPPIPLQKVVIEKPDKTKKYYVNLSGQKYGPLEYRKIIDLKKMGFVNDNTRVTESITGREYRAGDFE